ncbi:expressed unknown protein [Seminavis robusta]|uniref:Uncharacterized protein n=1 Tax=Seminavis robusta TaxID=568900 RepID=A0A9N8DFB3_9STRA|nr:expressed unknown protein [Seminavis robusta]|eukprot:Sro91_g047610.1 n/a (275) ;mRNA; r:35051-35875
MLPVRLFPLSFPFTLLLLTRALVVEGANPHPWNTSVSLTDNLMEPDGNGFCIDILGPQSNLNCTIPLHVHSCKPSWPTDGLDNQFMYDATNMRLRAAHYAPDCTQTSDMDATGCVSVLGDIMVGASVEFVECVDGMDPHQMFMYDNMTQYLSTTTSEDTRVCLTAGMEMNPAGPLYKRRSLSLQECAAADASGNMTLYQQWTIVSDDMYDDDKDHDDGHDDGQDDHSHDNSTEGSSSSMDSDGSDDKASAGFSSVIGTVGALLLVVVQLALISL